MGKYFNFLLSIFIISIILIIFISITNTCSEIKTGIFQNIENTICDFIKMVRKLLYIIISISGILLSIEFIRKK